MLYLSSVSLRSQLQADSLGNGDDIVSASAGIKK